MDTSGPGLIDLNQRLRVEASGMVSLWDEVGRMCLTRKVTALMNATNGTTSYR